MAAAGNDLLRRVPPQNIEAEQSVLGAVLLDNDAINQAIETLAAEDFYRESHREIFRAMVALTGRVYRGTRSIRPYRHQRQPLRPDSA